MNVLILVASKHGSTYEIGEAIAAELNDHGHTAHIYNAIFPPPLEPYDAVILGSAIYAGNWLPEAKQFAEQYNAELAKLPVWVFSSGPIGAENAQPHDDPAKLAVSLGRVKVRDHRIFVGKLDKANLNIAERLIARVVHSPSGDFRDWDAIQN